MPKFRKKPVEIEAVQYLGEPVRGVCDDADCWVKQHGHHVHTIHDGQVCFVKEGDWIIPEPDGVHFYPCNAYVFSETYEVCP